MSRSVIQYIFEARGKGTGPEFAGGTDTCICPKCKTTVSHVRGIPCNETACPNCGSFMTGKGAPGDLTKKKK